MKVLESTPHRYDRGIHMLSRGAIDAVYQRLAELLAGPRRRIVDVGCGTGNVALECAARGADVVGLDINAGMLEVARAKSATADEVAPEGLAARTWWPLHPPRRDRGELQGGELQGGELQGGELQGGER